jgi:hypothetical protein
LVPIKMIATCIQNQETKMTQHDLLTEMRRASEQIKRLRRRLELNADDEAVSVRCPVGMPKERFEKLKANLATAEDAAGLLSRRFISQHAKADPNFEVLLDRAQRFDADKTRWAQMTLMSKWPTGTDEPS